MSFIKDKIYGGPNLVIKWQNNSIQFIDLFAIVAMAAKKLLHVEFN